MSSLALYHNYLQKLLPVNLSEEKERFFINSNYNPQFTYREEIDFSQPPYKGVVEKTLFPQAEEILERTISRFGSDDAFIENTEGALLSPERTIAQIQQYLQDNKLDHLVDIVTSSSYVSRTAVEKMGDRFEIRIKTPLEYREKGLLGTLHHEVGTHLFRWLNEAQQPWNEKRENFQLSDYRETEEGLASLHSLLDHPFPVLWLPALYYYTIAQAESLSFVELFYDLKRFAESPEKRWTLCLRAKRGMKDTSQPGAFYKDQTYFTGNVKVAQWITKNPEKSELLYLGKIAVEDIEKLKKENIVTPILPKMVQNKDLYLEKMQHVFQVNNI